MSAAGGTLLVGQSGGPTPVINASLAGVIAESQSRPEVTTVLGMRHGIEGFLQGRTVDLTRLPADRLEVLRRTPASALGSCRYKVQADDYPRIMDAIEQCGVDYFCYIGGNDSMDTAHQVRELARQRGSSLRVVGAPKTIDNDLVHTDHCPGYGSAARFVALAAMCAGRDLESMRTFDRVTIMDCMGRDSGFLTAAAALGRREDRDPPHIVLLPERPFDEAEFLGRVDAACTHHGFAFVAACEGIRDAGGELIASRAGRAERDAFGHALVTLGAGVAYYLAQRVKQELGLQARHVKCDTVQRSFAPCASTVDLAEAYAIGRRAVSAAVDGEDGTMVALQRVSDAPYQCALELVALERVANVKRSLPEEFIAPDGGITDRFRRYAAPLIGEPLPEFCRL